MSRGVFPAQSSAPTSEPAEQADTLANETPRSASTESAPA
jgi:hypothetical protein